MQHKECATLLKFAAAVVKRTTHTASKNFKSVAHQAAAAASKVRQATPNPI